MSKFVSILYFLFPFHQLLTCNAEVYFQKKRNFTCFSKKQKNNALLPVKKKITIIAIHKKRNPRNNNIQQY